MTVIRIFSNVIDSDYYTLRYYFLYCFLLKNETITSLMQAHEAYKYEVTIYCTRLNTKM